MDVEVLDDSKITPETVPHRTPHSAPQRPGTLYPEGVGPRI
jgi:hypothetical protein